MTFNDRRQNDTPVIFILFFEIIHRIHIVIHSVTPVISPIDRLVRCDVIPAK